MVRLTGWVGLGDDPITAAGIRPSPGTGRGPGEEPVLEGPEFQGQPVGPVAAEVLLGGRHGILPNDPDFG